MFKKIKMNLMTFLDIISSHDENNVQLQCLLIYMYILFVCLRRLYSIFYLFSQARLPKHKRNHLSPE